MTKYLIINADDFGMSKVFNEPILDLIKNKKIKSTTVMVDKITKEQSKQIKELIELSKSLNLSVGLHLDFKSSNYQNEIESQFNKFLQIFDFIPSHIDIHKASIIKDSIPIVANFCRIKKLPCRNKGKNIDYYKTTDFPSFHGTTNDFSNIENYIKTFEDEKSYEILFHPGIFDPKCKSSLNKDRERDIKHALKLNSLLEKHDIKQISYIDLASTL